MSKDHNKSYEKADCCRGKKGRYCCCSTFVGVHFTGFLSLALLVFYFILLVRSSHADNFNWEILILIFIVGFTRVAIWFMMFGDTIYKRRWYSLGMAISTVAEFFLFVLNLIFIFTDDESVCDRVFTIKYMVVNWDIKCDWAIFLNELMATTSILYFIYASMCAYDHYHMGFHDQMLRDKERDRLEVIAAAGKSQEKIL